MISLATQFALSLILIAIIIQIMSTQEYYSIFLIFISGIAYGSSAAVSVIASIILVSWFKISRGSYVTLIFGAAFAFNVYVFVYVPLYDIQILSEKDRVVTAASEVIFSTDSFLTQPGSFQENFFDIYRYLSTAIFLMFVIGSATMLHHYASKMGRLKFWILLLLPLVYYASTLIDIVEIYVPQSDQEIFNYYLYASLIGVAGGGLLGFAFWTISNALKPNKAVMNYLRLCACGFILNVTASVASISAAPYPPFGAVSISVLTLSSYMIILGLYSTAVSISQDIRLRQFIKNMTKKDLGFLSNIGQLSWRRRSKQKPQTWKIR